jgi:hypothetical protein
MFHGVHVSSESVQDMGGGFFDFYSDIDTVIRYDERLEMYMERLTFNPDRDVVVNDNGVFVRFTYPAAFPGRISYSFARNSRGRPDWVNNSPSQIGGFMVGVGFSPRLFRLQDTYTKSYESAAAVIVSQLSTNLTASGVSVESYSSSVISQRSEGRLSNFLILEIWMDPQTQAVWTLAVAQ